MDSGNTMRRAPLAAASVMCASSRSTVASRSRNTGVACTAATVTEVMSRSFGAGGYEQFARADEPVRCLELSQRRLDVGPHALAFLRSHARQHLVEGTERFALEPEAFDRRAHPHRR